MLNEKRSGKGAAITAWGGLQRGGEDEKKTDLGDK